MGLLRATITAALIGLIGFFGLTLWLDSKAQNPSFQAEPNLPERAVGIEEIEKIWRNWMASNGVTKASLAIGRAGDIVYDTGFGIGADDMVPAADLSQTITALCLARLFDTQALSFNLTLEELKDNLSTANFVPPIWAQSLTVSELVTHTSGLEPDVTQDSVWRHPVSSEARHRRIALAALAQTAMRGTRGKFFYNSGNYAVLGVIIETLSRLPYDIACQEELLSPAGVTTAGLSGPYAANSSFGGWEISTNDYLRFVMHWTKPDLTWVAYPGSYPQAPLGNRANTTYNLGFIRSAYGEGVALYNFNRSCNDDPTARQTGAGVILIPGDWAIVATWNTCTTAEQATDLLFKMLDAAR